MRHQYTPIFREFTTSSMWAESCEVRCVWVYLMLHADPEGFVPGTIPGLAVAANVALEATRGAIEKFLAPDPDSNTQENEGRRLEKVPHGWRILNFVYWRELAKTEGEKARKREFMRRKRMKQLPLPFPEEFQPLPYDDEDHLLATGERPPTVALSTSVHSPLPVDVRSETVDAPKPKPKPTPKPEGEESPLPPGVFDAPVIPVHRVFHNLDGLDETGLEDEALAAGVPREWFRERLASARNLASIGGASGVRDQREWVRQQYGKWKTWWETNRAKDAQRSAGTGPSSRFGSADAREVAVVPEPKHEAFARQHGLDLSPLLHGVLTDHPQPVQGFSRLEVLGERLRVAAKQKRAGHPVTGKLTRAEFAEWGPVPAGGGIPEPTKGAA